MIAIAQANGASPEIMAKLIAELSAIADDDSETSDAGSVAGSSPRVAGVDGGSPPPLEEPKAALRKPTTPTRKLDFGAITKVNVPAIKRVSANDAKNFLFLFNSLLKRYDLQPHAYWGTGTAEEDDALSHLVLKAVELDAEILTDLRTRFGELGTTGYETFSHVPT